MYVGLKLINKPGQYHYFKMGKVFNLGVGLFCYFKFREHINPQRYRSMGGIVSDREIL